jgi:hypothetical protein
MTNKINKDILFEEYIKALERKIGTGYFMSGDPKPSEMPGIALRMMYAIDDSVRKEIRKDWLTHNPALREACRKLGIKTSKELREVW